MTQHERIYKHLQKHKDGITSLDAINDYGITRLASVICKLRHEGHNITSELIPVINRYGEVAYISRYKLED